MSFRSKVLRGAVWSVVQSWGTQFGTLAIFFLLARLLTPEAFGLVTLASVFLALMQVFVNQGFADALIQREHLEAEHLDAAFWTCLLLGVSLMSLGVGSAGAIAAFFRLPQLAPVLRCFAVIVLIDSLSSVHQAQLQRQFAFKALAVRNLLGIFSGGLVGIFVALSGGGVWALAGQQLTQELVALIVLWQATDWRPRCQFSFKHWQELLDFGLNQLAFNLLVFCNDRMDDFLIGYFLGPVSLGYYSLAYRILIAMTSLLVNSSSQVALPTFARLQKDLSRCRAAFYQATKLTSALAFPVFTGVAVLAPELIVLLFGAKWLPAVPVLRVLMIVGALRSVTYFKGAIFLAMGKPHWRLRVGALNSALNIVGFLIAVHWGIVAVALAYLVRACIMFPIGQWAVGKLINLALRQYVRQFVPAIASALIMSSAIIIIRSLASDTLNLSSTLVLESAIAMLCYSASLYCLDPVFFRQSWQLLTAATKSS